MSFEHAAEEGDDARSKVEYEHREGEEPHESSGENREEEMGKSHFEHCGGQDENFERHGRRKHPRKHQCPEFVLFERAMNFEEALFGNPFAEYFLAAQVADDVERDASQRRAQRGHSNVQKHAVSILIHISRNDEVDRHAEQGAVGKGDYKDAPNAQQFHQAKNPRRVARQDLRQFFQAKKLVYVIARVT